MIILYKKALIWQDVPKEKSLCKMTLFEVTQLQVTQKNIEPKMSFPMAQQKSESTSKQKLSKPFQMPFLTF